jgi:hypothetical protein
MNWIEENSKTYRWNGSEFPGESIPYSIQAIPTSIVREKVGEYEDRLKFWSDQWNKCDRELAAAKAEWLNNQVKK